MIPFSTRNSVLQLAIFRAFLLFCPDKIAFDLTNCLISFKNNTKHKYSNLTVRLIISQEQSWPSGLNRYSEG